MPSRLTKIAVASAAGVSALSIGFVAIPAIADTATGTSPGDAVSKRVSAIRDRLQGLVDDKTLTDAQADKVADTLGKQGGPLGGDRGPGGFGRHGGFGFGLRGDGLEQAAKVLGMSEDDVRSALRDGTTLAALAKKQGKDVAAVEGALTKAANDRVDQAVKDGKLTQAQADDIKKKTADAVKRFVEQGFAGMKGMGPGRFGGPGPWRDGDRRGDGQGAPAPSPSASASTSSF